MTYDEAKELYIKLYGKVIALFTGVTEHNVLNIQKNVDKFYDTYKDKTVEEVEKESEERNDILNKK
jgi:hypothetical protein